MRIIAPPTHQMFHISVQEFKEYVCLSHSWSDLARRCGNKGTKHGCICSRIITILKQKVLFLNLDTQHFKGEPCIRTARDRRAWIEERVGEVGKCRKSDVHEMYRISPEEFSELVRISDSWSDLARCCGNQGTKKKGGFCDKLLTVLKKKVLFLKLDTQHFTSSFRR